MSGLDPYTAFGIATDALYEIKREQGKVCSNFELCEHAACRSSYASWAIADKALAQLDSTHPLYDVGKAPE